MNDMWDSTGCFQIQFEFSGMRLRSLNDKIKLTLFYIRIYKSCNHRDLMEEYNSLTVLMLTLSSWRNRYHDKLWAPWKPPFIKYLGIAKNVVYPPFHQKEKERWPDVWGVHDKFHRLDMKNQVESGNLIIIVL